MSNDYTEEYDTISNTLRDLQNSFSKWKTYRITSGIFCVDDTDRTADGGEVLLMGKLSSEDEYRAYSRVSPASEQDYADPFVPSCGLWITREAMTRFMRWREAEWDEEENDSVDETDWKALTLEHMAVRGAMFQSGGEDIAAPLIYCTDEDGVSTGEPITVVVKPLDDRRDS